MGTPATSPLSSLTEMSFWTNQYHHVIMFIIAAHFIAVVIVAAAFLIMTAVKPCQAPIQQGMTSLSLVNSLFFLGLRGSFFPLFPHCALRTRGGR